MKRLILGIQAVREAIRSENTQVADVLIAKRRGPKSSAKLDALARFARDHHVPVSIVPVSRLDRAAKGTHHQGVAAYASELELKQLHDLLDSDLSLIMALDRISDPQNFGAIVRTSVGFGADAILWPEHDNAPLSPAMFRASAGAVEHATLCRVPSLKAAIQDAKSFGWQVVGLAGEAKSPMHDLDLTKPTVLLVGSEGTGIHRSLRAACTHLVRLPTLPPLGTLNASVSAAIALYEVRRQRLI